MGSSNFNLEQSIHDSISLIQSQGSITSSDASELKCHLYDATDALRKQGLSEEESFIIASKRLGKEELLTEEYSKVNTSVKTNKTWAYLIVGFNLFYAIPAILFSVIALFYYFIYKYFQTSITGVVIITSFHLLFTMFLWAALKYKLSVSNFIERQIEQRPIQLIFLSFIPQLINIFNQGLISRTLPELSIRRYALYIFQSSWIEFSFFMAVISIIGVVISLIFSLNKVENLTPKSLFQKPTIPFLLAFGLVVELLAASTRVIHTGNIVVNGLSFGLVYMAASFAIAFYNRHKSASKYITIAFIAGLLLEIIVGCFADLERNSFYTFYFVAGLLSGVAAGRFLGVRFGEKTQIAFE